jgi:hypothetical protein
VPTWDDAQELVRECCGRRFWEIADDERLEDFLFHEIMEPVQLRFPDEQRLALPQAYRDLVAILEFESHCQFDGWTAVSNEGADRMRKIIESYRSIGLAQEAAALEAVVASYLATSDADPRFHDILGAAYSSVANDLSEFEDRLRFILGWVRSNGHLFAEERRTSTRGE